MALNDSIKNDVEAILAKAYKPDEIAELASAVKQFSAAVLQYSQSFHSCITVNDCSDPQLETRLIEQFYDTSKKELSLLLGDAEKLLDQFREVQPDVMPCFFKSEQHPVMDYYSHLGILSHNIWYMAWRLSNDVLAQTGLRVENLSKGTSDIIASVAQKRS